LSEAVGGRALVLGLGHPLRGDDGIGPAVLEAVRATGRGSVTMTLWPAHEGDLLDALLSDTWDQVVVVDAAEIGAVPGEWTRLEGSGSIGEPGARAGTHHTGLLEALAVARALGRPPGRLTILAVQPASVAWGSGLSQPVARAVPRLCIAVLQEVAPEGRLA
jgi:hydrogenase maturation protease